MAVCYNVITRYPEFLAYSGSNRATLGLMGIHVITVRTYQTTIREWAMARIKYTTTCTKSTTILFIKPTTTATTKDIPLYESMNHRDPIYVLPSLLVFLSDAQQDDRDETCIYRLIIIITQSTCIVYVTTIVVLRPFIIDKSYVQISS